VLQKSQNPILWSPACVYHSEARNLALEGDIELILLIFRNLDPDVMRVRYSPFVAIAILCLVIKSQALNRHRAVKWLMVVQQPIQKIDKYMVKEYILIESQHQSTKFMSPVLFNLCLE